MSRNPARNIFLGILSLVAISATFSIDVARAQAVSEDAILKALKPEKNAPVTRSLSMGAPLQATPANNEAEGKVLKALRNRKSRSLSPMEREQITAIVTDKPKIDLEINFDYNSDQINSRSLTAVQTLGRALANPDLKGSTFVIAGHTDGAGGEAYNQELSERRADSIRRYLVDKSGIPADDLVTVGYGKTKLKDSANPLSEVNRRVQVVNTENKATASK
jgi:outer membrane protein OmpA-like peptidoglycan-associated protein